MRIVIATHMDCDAIYVDGIKEQEEHSLWACDLVVSLEKKLPCTIDSIETRSVDEAWWYSEVRDSYPDKIEDVVFDKEVNNESK